MLKPIVEVYPVLQAANEDERARVRPLGRDAASYHATLAGWEQIIRHAEELGFWGAAAIEHHFHSEGFEVGPAPGILNAYWAAITKKLHVGQLGYVLGTHNPIRVAEETAILDHLSGGRFFVGLARGYQSRWTGTLGQHFGARATKSPTAGLSEAAAAAGFATSTTAQKDLEDDALNRAIFEEHVEILLEAWTRDSFHHKGRNWQIPFPFDRGVEDWPMAKAGVTQRMGALDEIDAKGALRNVSVVPAPFTKPHPPVFLSGSGSPETIEYAARQGFNPVYFCNAKTAGPLAHLYRDVAAKAGKPPVAWGQKQAVVRWIHIGDTDEQAQRFLRESETDIWKNFYGAMGRRPLGDDPVGTSLATGLISAGSVETVRKDLIEQWKIVPAEYIVLIYHYAQVPLDWVLANMDAFIHKIQPALEEVIQKAS